MDKYLQDKLDQSVSYLQKRGINLTTLHVALAGSTFISSLVINHIQSHTFGFVLCGVVWGINLFGYLRWANNNKSYYESLRMTEKLNAKVLWYRETGTAMRFIWVFLFMMGVFFTIIHLMEGNLIVSILEFISSLSLALMFWLNSCFFCGPGEFAKEKKLSIAGNLSSAFNR